MYVWHFDAIVVGDYHEERTVVTKTDNYYEAELALLTNTNGKKPAVWSVGDWVDGPYPVEPTTDGTNDK